MSRPRRALVAASGPRGAVLGLTALALAARLVGLGARTAHFDEARVAYWTLRFGATGEFAYRPIIHGPFLPVVNRRLFALLGASDATMRLPAAVLGGLLPATAWLLRDRLADREVVAVALVLAASPLLVAFSRFARSDVPLATFGFATFALGARALATGQRRYLVGAGLALGLALSTKENVLAYGVCWVGAAGLALVAPWLADRNRPPGRVAVREATERTRASIRPLLGGLLPAAVLAVAVAALFYAPRGDGPATLSAALADPGRAPAVLARATLGTWRTFLAGPWAGGELQGHPYLPYLLHLSGSVGVGAGATALFATVGIGAELRGPDPPRPAVVAAASWGVAGLVGYPLAADVFAPWLGVHVVVPLAVPAGVGLGAVVGWGRGRWHAGDRATAVALALVVLAVAGQTAAVLAVTYLTPVPRVNFLAQGAQPGSDLDPLVEDIEAAAGGEGAAVLYYGERFFLPVESAADRPPASDEVWPGWWLNRLPLPWYTERAGARTAYIRTPGALRERRATGRLPPIVVADVSDARELRPLLPDYDRRTYDLRLYGGTVVVYTDRSRLSASVEERAGSTAATGRLLRPVAPPRPSTVLSEWEG